MIHTAGQANPCGVRESSRQGPLDIQSSQIALQDRKQAFKTAQNRKKKMCHLKELPTEQVEAGLKH